MMYGIIMHYDLIQFYNQIVEAILLAIGITSFVRPKKNKFSILFISAIFNLCVYYLASNYKIRDLTIGVLLILVNCVLLKILKKDFCLKDIVIVILAYVSYLVCVYVSIQLFAWALNTRPMATLSAGSTYTLINLALLSKFLYLGVILLNIKVKISTVIDGLDEKWYLSCFGVLIVILTLVYYAITYMYSPDYVPISLFEYCLTIVKISGVAICFILFFKWYKVYYERKIESQKELEKKKVLKSYMNDNLSNLKRIKMDIDNKEHRMNYILQSIEYDLQNQSYEDAIKKLTIAKELVSKIEPVIYTGNEMFDFMINMEIKQLYLEHRKIKVGAFISKNDSYNEYSIWNTIVELIRLISNNYDYFEIFMIEKNESILEVKFIINEANENNVLIDKFKTIKDNINIKYIDHLLTITYKEMLMTN